ncbi:uncharacterized protein LOC143283928 [Babylonia areolata]|uniref:uncharacterized protein LOC143283928 n=1 Tax=Babylonia areolata TaxID=304850 RepID=UPI003FD01C31
MSTSSRLEIERRRNQAQRERASLAQVARDGDSFPRVPVLFQPPAMENRGEVVDDTTQLIESLFGPWANVEWKSGNPVLKPIAKVNNPNQKAREENNIPAHQNQENSRENRANHHRSNSEQRTELANKKLPESSRRSTSSVASHSGSSHSHHHAWRSSEKPSPIQPQHTGPASSAAKGPSLERERHHPAREFHGSEKHKGDNPSSHPHSSDRKSRWETGHVSRGRGPSTPPCSPPPNHSAQCSPLPDRTPPPSSTHTPPPPHHQTPQPPHGTPPPVRHTPPPPNHPSPPPPAEAEAQRISPPTSRSSVTKIDSKMHSGDSKPNLFLDIKREERGQLDDIFKEMAVTTPLTALSETPVLCKPASEFKFVPRDAQVDQDLKPKPSLPEPEYAMTKTEAEPTIACIPADLEADLAVSDDSDIEDVTPEDDKKNQERATNLEVEVNNASSDDSSSSDSSSASESESSSSDSEEENGEDDPKGDMPAEKEKTKPVSVASTPPDKKSNGSWGLSQFITKSSPASVLNTTQASTEVSASKGGSSQEKIKTSPRKMAEIGPCDSMPFFVHDESDPIPRNSEKSSASPDTVSTPSSHTSSLDAGKVSQNKTRRDSNSDSSVNAKAHPAPKVEVSKVCERPKVTSGEGNGAGNPAADSAEPAKSSNQQNSQRRTSNSGGPAKASKKCSVVCSPSEEDNSVPQTKPVLGKRDVPEQQPVDGAGGETVADSILLSSSACSKKIVAAGKTKTPSSSIAKGATKSSTKKNLSSKGSGEDRKSSSKHTVNTDISSLVDDVRVETSLHGKMLSPIRPSAQVDKSDALAKELPVPTLTCGKPSIIVRLQPCLLLRTPAPTKKNKKAIAAATKLTPNASPPNSMSERGRGDNKQTDSSGIQLCVKSASEKTGGAGSVKKRLSDSVDSSPPPPAKKKKADAEDRASSKKAPSHISNKSPELNGVAHPEELPVKKAGLKRKAQRRSSAGSNSSRSSQKTGPLTKKVKKTEQVEEKAANGVEGKQVSKEDLPFDSYKQPDVKSPKPAATPIPPPPLQPEGIDNDYSLAAALEKMETQEFYVTRAKDLKHVADKKQDKPSKLIPYIRSVLYFIMWAHSCEEHLTHPAEFPNFIETLSLTNHIYRIRNSILSDRTPTDKERILSILILRIQALLSLKMYNMRRLEAMKLKKVIESESNNKGSSVKMLGHAPSPHQNHWNKNSTGTPSPMSPTPSPACSIGSVESQGSCEHPGNKLSNGVMSNGTITSPGTIAVASRMHSATQKFLTIVNPFVQSFDTFMNTKAEIEAHKSLKDFFGSIDQRCGMLAFESNLRHLVVYVYWALKELGPYPSS